MVLLSEVLENQSWREQLSRERRGHVYHPSNCGVSQPVSTASTTMSTTRSTFQAAGTLLSRLPLQPAAGIPHSLMSLQAFSLTGAAMARCQDDLADVHVGANGQRPGTSASVLKVPATPGGIGGNGRSANGELQQTSARAISFLEAAVSQTEPERPASGRESSSQRRPFPGVRPASRERPSIPRPVPHHHGTGVKTPRSSTPRADSTLRTPRIPLPRPWTSGTAAC
mmetsp:Transcript_23646/g.52451  ORF Transcript_23646/g.52451 Transcript_23646/m.52451 type:complete len:226 (-) Transcript_23646:202-879(-)